MYEFAVAPAVTNVRRRGVTITEVADASLGAELELAPGDRIVKVNGRIVRDYLDFRFHTSGETELVFEIRKADGEDWEIELEREEGEDLGLTLEAIVPRQCANECLFCFCKGNPQDARPSLFIRDEDVRLSFLYGNYTTLTSLSEDELKRIIEQRLSPQYVSIHATDLDVRAYLLGVDKKRADISEKFNRLLEAGIEIHAQVVLCPGINDGEILEKTIRDLAAHHPSVNSVAIVPVALTRYNTDERLARVTPEFCRRTIAEVETIQAELLKTSGTNFAFLGDEIYLKAGVALPSRRHYGDYPQIEDGVGMVRAFENSFAALLRQLAARDKTGSRNAKTKSSAVTALTTSTAASLRPTADYQMPTTLTHLNGTVLTGEMFAPVLRKMVEILNLRHGARLRVAAVKNNYFGGDVAVAGLLTGGDMLAARAEITGDFVIIPHNTLKTGEAVLLDGITLDELQAQMGVPVLPFDLKDLKRFVLTPPQEFAAGSLLSAPITAAPVSAG